MTSEEVIPDKRTSGQWKKSLKGENEKFAQASKVGKHFHCDEGQSKHMSQPNPKF